MMKDGLRLMVLGMLALRWNLTYFTPIRWIAALALLASNVGCVGVFRNTNPERPVQIIVVGNVDDAQKIAQQLQSSSTSIQATTPAPATKPVSQQKPPEPVLSLPVVQGELIPPDVVEPTVIRTASAQASAPDDFPPLKLPPLPSQKTVPVQAQAAPVAPAPPSTPLPAPQATPSVVTVDGAPLNFDTLSYLAGANPVPASITGCAACGTGGCEPGCQQCEQFPKTNLFNRFIGGVYENLCCPDPCYQPRWIPLADTAFFTESARPVNQTRIRWENARDVKYFDRGEYLFARSDGKGKGPKPLIGRGVTSLDYNELSQYTEIAANPGMSMFVVTPYRAINFQNGDPASGSGFTDISLGTKSVLHDTELFQLALQFKTYMPSANPQKGLGTGHLSLEPSLIFGLKLSKESYLQGQIAEWIPMGADSGYGGTMLHYHFAFNHVLWKPIEAVQLVGTMELSGFSFQSGGFTDPVLGYRSAVDNNFLHVGPGMRLFFCDKYDFGIGSAFGVTGTNSLGQALRMEMRVRY